MKIIKLSKDTKTRKNKETIELILGSWVVFFTLSLIAALSVFLIVPRFFKAETGAGYFYAIFSLLASAFICFVFVISGFKLVRKIIKKI